MLSALTDPSAPLSYLFIILLILCSAFFSGSEAAYLYCNRYKIKVWADDGMKKAKMALRVLDKLDNTIIAILIGNNIVNVLSSVIATVLAVALLGEIGASISTVVITIIIFIFAEILPKNIGKSNANKWALYSSYIMYFLIILFTPFIFIFNCLVKFIKIIFGLNKTKEDEFTDDDFQDVVENFTDEGVIDEEDSEIIIAAVDWGDMVVSEVLTQRKDIVALNIKDCTEEKLRKFLIDNTYSRIPIYEGSINNIIGILHVRMYLKELFINKNVNLRDILLKPYIVSPRIKIDEIFEGFKEHQTHVAIVQEKGRTIGMVTMKDILEELVSDIDEADTSLNEGGESDVA